MFKQKIKSCNGKRRRQREWGKIKNRRSCTASNSEGTNYFFLTFFSCFVEFFPRKQISVLNIVPPPWPVLKFRDLVRKWHHSSNDSTDVIFRLILSVLYFSLISSCVSHHLLWHLFFWCPSVSRPDDLFSLLKFGFVGMHHYSSLNTLLSCLQYWALQLDRLGKLKSG